MFHLLTSIEFNFLFKENRNIKIIYSVANKAEKAHFFLDDYVNLCWGRKEPNFSF